MAHEESNSIIALEDIFYAIGNKNISFLLDTPTEELKVYRDKILDILNMLDDVIDDSVKMSLRPTASLQKYIYPAWPQDSELFPAKNFVNSIIGNKVSTILYVAERIADARISLASSGAMRYPWSSEAPISNKEGTGIGSESYKTGFF